MTTAIIGFGIFFVSGIASVLYLVAVTARGGAGARSRGTGSCRGCPERPALDRVAHRTAVFGFPIWTFAVIAGAIWAESAWGRFWGWDPKETWAFIAWVVYAAYLHARTTAGWRGRPAAWVNVVGLVVMIFNLTVRQHGLHRPAQLRRRELSLAHVTRGHQREASGGPRAVTDDGNGASMLPCRPDDGRRTLGVTVGKHAAPDGASARPARRRGTRPPVRCPGRPAHGGRRGPSRAGPARRLRRAAGLGWPADRDRAASAGTARRTRAPEEPGTPGRPPRLAAAARREPASPEPQAGEPSSRRVRRSSSRRNSGSSSGASGRVGR